MRENIYQDCLDNTLSGKTRFWPQLYQKYDHIYSSAEALRSDFKREHKRRGVTAPSSFVEDSATKNTNGTWTSDKLIEMCEAEMKDDVYLLMAHGFDPQIWTIVWAKNNLYHGPIQGGKQTMYQSKITVKLKEIDDISLDDIEAILKGLSINLPKMTRRKYQPANEVLEITVMDTHFGSDANHAPEKRLSAAIDDVIARCGDRNFEKIILAILGDIFHYDNLNKTTAAGTIVTTNGLTAYEMFDLGLKTLVKNILKLTLVAPVEIVFIPGNHDPMIGYALVKVLEALFEDNKNITIDAEHSLRKFKMFGKNLVGWMHGDMPKARASSWLQVEAAKEWGESQYREIHSGNFHSQKASEDGGVVLRYLSGLTDIDDWHYKKGYVGAVRAMTAFVWDKEAGLREIWFANV